MDSKVWILGLLQVHFDAEFFCNKWLGGCLVRELHEGVRKAPCFAVFGSLPCRLVTYNFIP